MKKIAYLQLHRICDQDCIFCAQPSNGASLDYETLTAQIVTFHREGYSKIIFSGGEPSLNKDLIRIVEFTQKLWIEMTILSNGNRFCEREYAQRAIAAGLGDYHISMHSHIHSIHDALVKKVGSLERCFLALQTLLSLGAHITINITINSHNVDYFDRLIATVLRFFPGIDGFIINNLETSQIPKRYHSVIAPLEKIAKTIPRALASIEAAGKRVRIERVPMCYIRGFEHLSTDLEYTIGGEEKFLHYLGEFRESGELNRENYMNAQKYGPQCNDCDLKGLCAGMEWLHLHYDPASLIPQKVEAVERGQIVQKFTALFPEYVTR